MTPTPIRFFVGHPPVAISDRDPQWRASLPNGPTQATHGVAAAPEGQRITYGHYFCATADFLMRDHQARLIDASCRILHRPVKPQDIEGIRIHLVKHGAFYHPAQVSWQTGDDDVQMALNVAASPAGQKILRTEFDALQRLGRIYPDHFVPEVYGCGRGEFDPAQPALAMFAAQWMADFHEVHITIDPPNHRQQWNVWHDRLGRQPLTERQIAEFYRLAFYILTAHFNPFTFEAVLDWHHAAGDFVVRLTPQNLEVRLITVRRYARLFQLDPSQASNLDTVLDALLLFFLRTSLWIRLDRLDGVGDLVWAEGHDVILPSLWQGFRQGIARLSRQHGLPQPFDQLVANHIGSYSRNELRDLAETIITQQTLHTLEKKVLQNHLDEHAAQLSSLLKPP